MRFGYLDTLAGGDTRVLLALREWQFWGHATKILGGLVRFGYLDTLAGVWYYSTVTMIPLTLREWQFLGHAAKLLRS